MDLKEFKILGCYKYYKGNLYDVYEVVMYLEDESKLVVYCLCYGEKVFWVCFLNMFVELVEKDGEIFFCFVYVGNIFDDEKMI